MAGQHPGTTERDRTCRDRNTKQRLGAPELRNAAESIIIARENAGPGRAGTHLGDAERNELGHWRLEGRRRKARALEDDAHRPDAATRNLPTGRARRTGTNGPAQWRQGDVRTARTLNAWL